MSNVQLSSTLERVVARRTFPLHTRTGVCRNLFGPVDHDEVRVELSAKLGEMSEREQTRWNFNFNEDTPLPGRYAWEDVCVTSVPNFYRDSVQNGRKWTRLSENETIDSESTTLDYKDAKVSSCTELDSKNLNVFSANASGINQENCTSNANSGTRGCASSSPACCKNIPTPDSSRISSTQITDFFLKRKRTFVAKEPESTSQNVANITVAAEQTPRKRIR
ncbi:hypothetical protein ACEWY4_015830 [Coilia grayii]|uniref:Cyclin-dependent kinase inhibitor domain-containing protein n=1 Tax=Coilia grayii TaxID=363190 RepID=A0ABD1JP51_9TELE